MRFTWGLVGIGALLGAQLLAGNNAAAQTATTTFQVTATVVGSCIVSATDLAFGDFDPVAAADVDDASSLSVTCSNDASYNIGLSVGLGTGATIASRKMTGTPSGLLSYSLYSNAGRTTLWGDTIGVDTVPQTGTGAAQSIPVYGRVFGTQPSVPPVGSYADTITVTVTY